MTGAARKISIFPEVGCRPQVHTGEQKSDNISQNTQFISIFFHAMRKIWEVHLFFLCWDLFSNGNQ